MSHPLHLYRSSYNTEEFSGKKHMISFKLTGIELALKSGIH